MSTRMTIGEVLAGHAARDPNAVAILAPGLDILVFRDLDLHIRRIGDRLRAAGIGSSSRVGIALQRGPEAALLSIAVCCTAILLPINPNLPPADLALEMDKLRLDALIVTAEDPMPSWIEGKTACPGLFTVKKALSSFAEIDLVQVRPVRRPMPCSLPTMQSWAAIFRTSGTTGVSKRVPVTHENLIEMADKMEKWLGLTPDDRSACIMPIYYNAGFKATLLVPLLIGCSVALPRSTTPADFDQWLVELRPTWITASPAFLQAVIEKLQPYTHRPTLEPASLRFVLSTASYLPETVRSTLENILKVPVGEFYGLCEAGMMTKPAFLSDAEAIGSVGLAPAGELAIRDTAGNLQPPGQAGEVVLRGPSVMPGYVFDDIEGEPSGLDNEWLATGDLGVLDDKGFLRILGRFKEIINRGGEKIAPYDVEKALLLHPAVREAAAFPVPHPRLGESVCVAVVLHAGAAATNAGLMDFAYQQLAPFQMPRHIHIVNAMPLGPTGKISRAQLSVAFGSYRQPTVRPATSLEILIADIWQRVLRRDDIGLDDDFVQIGGDSLQAAEMMVELEELTHQRIDPADIRANFTIRSLRDTLARKASQKQELITEVRSGSGTPLFLCHGDFCGWGMYGFRLAELLEGNSPVYLLHSMLDVAEGVETIEEMASRYLPHIEKVAPTGPVLLAGYCHGGLAALEVAHRLEHSGRTVEAILLIDTFSINARTPMRAIVPCLAFASAFVPGGIGRRLRRSGMPSLWRLVSHLLAGDRAIARRITRTIKRGKMQIWDSSRRTIYYRAMSKFVPSKIHARMICLLSDEYGSKNEYATGPWKNIAGDVVAHDIRGEHSTCISRYVGDLATRMNETMFVDAIGRSAPRSNHYRHQEIA